MPAPRFFRLFTLLIASCLPAVITPDTAYGNHYPPPKPVSASDIPDVIKKISAPDYNTKFEGLNELMRLHPVEAGLSAIPDVIAITKLQKNDSNNFMYDTVQVMAVRVMGRLPKTEESIKYLFEAVHSPDKNLSLEAARSIPIDSTSMEQVKAAYKHDESRVRSTIISRFSSLRGYYDKDAIELMNAALADPEKKVRIEAALLLHAGKNNHSEFAPALIAAIKVEKEVPSQLIYMKALAETGGAPADELPLFIPLLKAENEFLRYYSARIIGSMGSKAAEAVPSLITALKQPARLGVAIEQERMTLDAIIEALGNIAPDDARVLETIKAAASLPPTNR